MGSMSKDMWQPIETAPRDGTIILAYDGCSVQSITWREDRWVTDWDHDPTYEDGGSPTHWMPLPEAPE